jgi:CRISPR-associated endonuclease/helicase Cas3
VQVRLLHSRYTQEDRRRKEMEIAREFGKEREEREQESMILVATQVVEVGLNITCDRLHTEIAPANAVLQRAGRCARYPGEEGHVHIYMVPERQSRGDSELIPDFLPYPSSLCQAAWMSFSARNGQEIDFQTEQQIVDEVHTESDRQLLEAMDRQTGAIWSQIYASMENQDRSHRQDLIRHIDSITVLAAATPEAVGNPFRSQGFSFHRGSVFGLWTALQQEREENWEGDEFEEEPWLMALPQISEPDPETPGAHPEVHWLEVTSQDLLTIANVVVINSRFCAYDDELGFRIVEPKAASGWQSQPGAWSQGNSGAGFSYTLESYEDHISHMVTIYRQRFQSRYAYVGRRLAGRHNGKSDELDRAVHLAIACHDAAKMDRRWQRWVRSYQDRIGKPISQPDFMAVHTDFDPTDPAHVQAKQQTDREVRRPPHAGESAVAAARPIAELLEDPPLARAVLTAIARHHSPSVNTFKPFRLHPAAVNTLQRAIQIAGLPQPNRPIALEDKKGGLLERILIEPDDFWQLLLYFYVVRALRLCDSMSQTWAATPRCTRK